MADNLIIGGGVIGMLMARELAAADTKITLIEQSRCASESSWAGGGIISPLYPWRYQQPISALASWSQDSYSALAADLYAETGIDVELKQHGMLILSVADADQAQSWSLAHNRPLQTVNKDFIQQLEPNLHSDFDSAFWLPQVSSIRNPRLGRALRQSLEQNPNIELIEDCTAQSFCIEQEAIRAVQTTQGKFAADNIIVTAGAWAGELLKALNVEVPITPVCGQMMLFNAKPGLLNRLVLNEGRYLIPRQDGRILVGSTLEHRGFDKSVTTAAKASLYESAVSLLPALAEAKLEQHWAGLRPSSPAGLPFIGKLPQYKNLYINAGHFRNGLVLAPASTKLLADQLLGREPIIDPRPYQPFA